MERRPGKKVTVCSREAELTVEEERVVRMVQGVTVDPRAPLAQKASFGSELADELSMIELGLFRAQRKAVAGPASGASVATGSADERAKSKIIRALRRKR